MTAALLSFVAAHGLPGQRSAPPPITGDMVDAVLSAAAEQRLIGLLDQAVADGAVDADAQAAERIGEEAVRVQAWSLLVERHHLAVHECLAEAGIATRFLKGPAIGHRFYAHPGLRTFADVDVLVPGAELDRAVAVLLDHGHRRDIPELTPRFDATYGKSVTLTSDRGIEVDLHRILASGPYGLVRPPDALWARSAAVVRLADTDLPVLDAAAALVHAGVHAVTGVATRLGSLRDVAELARVAESDPTLMADARALAADLGVTACVAEGAMRAARRLDIANHALDEMATWPTTARDRRWLGLYAHRTTYARLAGAAIPAIPGILPKIRYATTLVRARRAHRHAP